MARSESVDRWPADGRNAVTRKLETLATQYYEKLANRHCRAMVSLLMIEFPAPLEVSASPSKYLDRIEVQVLDPKTGRVLKAAVTARELDRAHVPQFFVQLAAEMRRD